MFEADHLILLVAATLILGYISSFFYSKTKIPDIIWLLFFGMLVGPVLGLFDKGTFLALSPLMSIVALGVILFDAGINVDIVTVIQTMGKSSMLAICTFLSVVAAVGLALNFLLPSTFNILQALLLGSMIGGTSTIAVFGILGSLGKVIPNIESTRVILMMESVISDPLCIVVSITIIRMVMLPGVMLIDAVKEIFSVFTLSSALGFVAGMLWAWTLDRLRGRPFTYMMTLSILFPSYIMADTLIGEGGGTMTALTFGLSIANYKYIASKLGLSKGVKIDKRRLREFHEEITFLTKCFFFVYIGLIVTLSLGYTLIGLGIVGLIVAVRYAVGTLVGDALRFSGEEKVLSRLIFAQGLPAFVMSQLPMVFDPRGNYFIDAEIYPNLCMPVVLGTVIFAALATPMIAKRQLSRASQIQKST